MTILLVWPFCNCIRLSSLNLSLFFINFQDDQGDDTRKSSRITKLPIPPGKRRKGRPRKQEEVAGGESNDEGDADDEDKSSSVFSVEIPVKKKRGRKPNSEKNLQKVVEETK